MNPQGKTKEILNSLAKGIFGNFLISAAALTIDVLLGGPKIYIEPTSARWAFFVLLDLYVIITFWSIFTLIKNNSSQKLITIGPYRYVRHPISSAIIFLLNPALAILFRSWLLFLAIIPIYFIWRKCAKKEDKYLAEKFSKNYYQYERITWRFLPNLWRVNKILFYIMSACSIFAVVFICLNFSAVYLRWVSYEKKPTKITYDDSIKTQPSPYYFQQMFESGSSRPSESQSVNQEISSSYKPSYSEQVNSIIIYKINVQAPLVFASGTTQKELNNALNQGVIIYPGSALPGQDGEVFLSGHSSSYPWVKTQYGQVFTLLDKLEAGDIVSLIHNHSQYDYQIIGKQILAPKDTKITLTNEPTLTLMTCWPIGTALNRLVVRGELIR
jgi:LPXTG-site transpeptidase (sortase) family protein